jgi:hypothetical protein
MQSLRSSSFSLAALVSSIVLCNCSSLLGDLDSAYLVDGGDLSDGASPRGDAGKDASSSGADAGGDSGIDAAAPRRLLLVGGESVASEGDVWTWDGHGWTLQLGALPLGLDRVGLAPLGTSIVLCGGESVTPDGGYTWDGTLTWDGVNWLRWNPNPAPTPRSGAAVATLGDRVVLFGGYGAVASNWKTFDDTWTWDGAHWVEEHPGTFPTPRAWASVATLGDTVVMYGGRSDLNSAASIDETWTWDGTNWAKVATPGPTARSEAAMASLGSAEAVLFGGHDPNIAPIDTVFGDTWTFDGHVWTERKVSGPSQRYAPAMGGLGGQVVLFGGFGSGGDAYGNLGDTWTWDGTKWTEQKVSGPGARGAAAMAADSSTGSGK